MARKKWTVKTEVDEALIQFREKRKWQIALRRYVLDKNKSSYYAPFFGLDIEKFREWIACQFDEDLNWQTFATAWQFDHIVPVAYFNFNYEEDMRLCWNFTNIRVEKIDPNKNRGNRVDVLAAKTYFEVLFERTGYLMCRKMIEKITQIESSQISANENLSRFIKQNKSYLDHLSGFTSYEYDKLNTGVPFESVLFEANFLKKFSTKS
jgi:hypothetical protein